MSAFWGWLCCQDTSLYSPPRPPHLEALALETSEPRQQLQKLGTSSPLSWRVGRGHKREGLGEGLFDLKPSPLRRQEGRGGRPQLGRTSRVSEEVGTAGG